MKALAVKSGYKNSVEVIEIPKPKPKENEILIRISEVGIDGTDREINYGLYGTPPTGSDYLILGHEAIGSVEEGRGKFLKGDLVVPTVRRPCSENCINCRSGESDMCLTGNYSEHGIYKLHGFASEYAISDYTYIVKVPEEIKDVGVLLEPMSIVEKAIFQSYKIQERMAWQPKKALVLGAGSIGLLAAAMLRLKGLEVYVSARNSERLAKEEFVKNLGAEYLVAEGLADLNLKFDFIIEATGNADIALKSTEMMNTNGILCFLGIYKEIRACEDAGKMFRDIVLKNKVVFGSVNANKKYFEMGVNHLLEIKKKYKGVLAGMITRFKMEDFRKAFEDGKIKTVVEFGGI